MHASLDKASNFNNSKTKKFKLKAQESKAFNLNNSLRFDPEGNTETFDKA